VMFIIVSRQKADSVAFLVFAHEEKEKHKTIKSAKHQNFFIIDYHSKILSQFYFITTGLMNQEKYKTLFCT